MYHMGLEMVEITMEVERHYSVSLPIRRVGDCRTDGDFLDLVIDVVVRSDSVVDSFEIDGYLRDMLVSQYAIKAQHITRDAELYGPKLNLG